MRGKNGEKYYEIHFISSTLVKGNFGYVENFFFYPFTSHRVKLKK